MAIMDCEELVLNIEYERNWLSEIENTLTVFMHQSPPKLHINSIRPMNFLAKNLQIRSD